ncbi:MAG: DUF1810 domain-containing protein [Deltaproteobacteria bacterium]|nr:DUF1810 domain-containing protein [Deltaproteobacteria bacterium]TLN02011.1 MAG: DUF1810 domain-containing protein [bacterium]
MTNTDDPTKREDPFDLNRFKNAQERVYGSVVAELRSGQKSSHWMWFIFPQIAGLGRSSTAQHYAIKSVAEARAYLKDPVLGARLLECTEILEGLAGRSASAIFGYPDDLKLRSSMTLFASVTEDPDSLFDRILEKYFVGEPDERTLALLEDLA